MGQPAGYPRGIGRLIVASGGGGEDGDSSDAGHPDAPATMAAHIGRNPAWTHYHDGSAGIVNTPVWRASTILYPTIADMDAALSDTDGRLFYGRKGTPTHWALREALDSLEPGAAGTMLYPSGVAALAGAMLAVLAPGDHLLIPDSAYDPTTAMAHGLLRRLGVRAEAYDPMLGGDIARLFRPETRLLLLESPGSLTFEVQDVPAMTAAARAAGVVTLIDNTWAASWFFKGLAAGCDMVMQAITKYIGGHSDLLMGSVTANAALWPRLRDTAWALGQCVSGDDAALALRGFRTLPVRMARHEASALTVARWLKAHPTVAAVWHPALPDCPGHAIWARDFTGASGLFGVMLNRGSRKESAPAFFDGLRLFGKGYSWGGYESLAIPTSPETLRRVVPFRPAGMTFRLSIGMEEPADLIADLEAALARI
jgi:cystathionine beta-lyase